MIIFQQKSTKLAAKFPKNKDTCVTVLVMNVYQIVLEIVFKRIFKDQTKIAYKRKQWSYPLKLPPLNTPAFSYHLYVTVNDVEVSSPYEALVKVSDFV